ncbi:MAG: peroxidase-related enzyme [Cyclobacteriaceae bacterium]
MSWIQIIPFDKAEGQLKKLYQRVTGPNNNVDNIMGVHSLRPHSMEGHMALYKNVLHHRNNTLPKSYLETAGVYVSHLNQCDYCVKHHFSGLSRLIDDQERADQIYQALKSESFDDIFSEKEKSGLEYARKLTVDHMSLTKEDIELLHQAGFDDGEVLELNQVVSYFNYANRTVLGLGVSTKGDILGLSPNDNSDPNNWGHS